MQSIAHAQNVISVASQLIDTRKHGGHKANTLSQISDEPKNMSDGVASKEQTNGRTTRRVNTAIDDDNLYLVMAMWLELFPDEQRSSSSANRSEAPAVESVPRCNRIGCVLVQQNGRLTAVDRGRDGIHGVARMLVKHHNQLDGCKVFTSRKPCSYCAKLLVHAGITAVAYPPTEREFPDGEDEALVDYLFKVGLINQNVFIPGVRIDLADQVKELPVEISLNDVQDYKEVVLKRFWSEGWVNSMQIGKSAEQRDKEFRNLLDWFARIYLPFDKRLTFRLSARCTPFHRETGQKPRDFDPENNKYHEHVAKHMLALATMTTQRTAEPRTGVGAVIMNNKDVVAVGWNQFPSTQIEEEFHRALDHERDEMYPFFIHAEQHALLMRNATDVTGGVAFVTKTPCHECVPLLKAAGIATVVLATSLEPIREKYRLDYGMFPKQLEKGVFVCYEAVSRGCGT